MLVDISDTLQRIYQDNPKWWPHGLSRDMLDDAHAIVERGSNKTAGFTGWQFRHDPDGKKVGYYAIGVLPEFRGKGYAKTALQQLIAAKPKDVQDVRAYIVPGNVPSENLAARLGVPVVRKSASLQGSQPRLIFTGMKSSRVRYVPSSYGGISLQQYMPLVPRRAELSPEEQAAAEEGQAQLLPKIFKSMADSPAVDMHSPGGGALMAGIGTGAALGGGLHYLGGAGAPMSAAVGGVGGLISSLIAYNAIKAKNEGILEMMRRIPEGGTRRDMEADPVLQADRNRQAQSGTSQEALRTAQLLAVLEASKKAASVKQAYSFGGLIKGMGSALWKGTKYTAAPVGIAGAVDVLAPHPEGQQTSDRVRNFALNTLLLLGAQGGGRLAGGKLPKPLAAGAEAPAIASYNEALAAVQQAKITGATAALIGATPGLYVKDFINTNMTAPKDIAQAIKDMVGKNAAPEKGMSSGQMLGLGLGAAGIIGGGGYLASKLIDSLNERTSAGERGRIRVTLPTRRPGDVETQVELPMHEIPLSNAMLSKVHRDFRGRLREETNARTKKVILSPEEKQRRADLLARYRLT